jgi:hypothetical protein
MKKILRYVSDYLWFSCGSNAGKVRRFKLVNKIDIKWARFTKVLSGIFYRLSGGE